MDATVLIVILVLVLILVARLGSESYLPGYGFLSDPNILWIIGIVIVLLVIWKAYKMGSGGGSVQQ